MYDQLLSMVFVGGYAVSENTNEFSDWHLEYHSALPAIRPSEEVHEAQAGGTIVSCLLRDDSNSKP